jgi:hypothetical protein
MNYTAVGAAPQYAEESDCRPATRKKVKKPGFLSRWFLRKLTEGAEWEKRQNQERESAISVNRLTNSLVSAGPPSIDQPERAIRFTVYSANGGRVIETQRYDRQKDRNNNGLYIITSDQDFGRELDKIITMEHLK